MVRAGLVFALAAGQLSACAVSSVEKQAMRTCIATDQRVRVEGGGPFVSIDIELLVDMDPLELAYLQVDGNATLVQHASTGIIGIPALLIGRWPGPGGSSPGRSKALVRMSVEKTVIVDATNVTTVRASKVGFLTHASGAGLDLECVVSNLQAIDLDAIRRTLTQP